VFRSAEEAESRGRGDQSCDSDHVRDVHIAGEPVLLEVHEHRLAILPEVVEQLRHLHPLGTLADANAHMPARGNDARGDDVVAIDLGQALRAVGVAFDDALRSTLRREGCVEQVEQEGAKHEREHEVASGESLGGQFTGKCPPVEGFEESVY